MNKDILNTGVQKFIKNNLNTDIVSVLLKKSPFQSISPQELAQQLEARKKCEDKLPTWFGTPQIYYPKKLHIEQSSSELTAVYKAGIPSGKSLLDTTGGFGVDSYFFSKKMIELIYCETNLELAVIAAHNFEILAIKNVIAHQGDGIEYLQNLKKKIDWVYIDPSRRHSTKGKVFKLSDCLPNVPEQLELIYKKSKNILIKTAPLLDISSGLKELQGVREIHVVAVKNEVKELLWVLEQGFAEKILVKTIDLRKKDDNRFEFYLDEEKSADSSLSLPQRYLYEPNAAILKSGAFKLVSNKFKINKLHTNTHLYTSDELIDFPGRRFRIDQQLAYNSKAIKALRIQQANIATRNFPHPTDQLRKKFKFKDGGESYLFFTRAGNDKLVVLSCSKV